MKQIQYEETTQGVKIVLPNHNILIVDGHITHCLRRYGDGYMLTTNEKDFKAYAPFIYPGKMVYDCVDIIELHRAESNTKQSLINRQLVSNAITEGYKKIAYLLQDLNNDLLSNNIIICLDGTYLCVSPDFFVYQCFLKFIIHL